MKKTYIFLFKIYLTIILIFIQSCGPNENPDLVNPPSQTETVLVRFLNLAGDKLPRTLVLDWKTQTSETPFSNVSNAIKPAIDSTFPIVLLSGSQEFKSSMKTRFVRSTNYTFISLPTADGSPNHRNVDTLISLTTLSGLPQSNQNAYIQLFNANSDSSLAYSLTLGCPNGLPLAQAVNYRGFSQLVEIRTDNVAVSLIRLRYGIPEIVGLYRLNIVKNGQYSLVVKRSNTGDEELWILDMMKSTTDAFTQLHPITERTANIRVLNFSNSKITAIKQPDEFIANDLAPKFLGKYISVNSCISETLDSLSVLVDNQIKSSVALSLDVLQNYTYLVFDSADAEAKLSLVAEPIRISEPINNMAIIRVVNASFARSSITVSLGARDNFQSSYGYESGEVLATNLKYGNISEPVLINGGYAPITIFSSTQPAQLLFCTQSYFEPNKSYLLLLTNELVGTNIIDRIALIEESETDKQIIFLEEGVFTQFVHLTPGLEKVQLSIDGALTNASVYYSGSLATVLPVGTRTININGSQKTIEAELGKRLMIISAGDMANIDILAISNYPLNTSDKYYNRRIINATKTIPSITVRIDSDSGFIAAEWLQYGAASLPQQVYLERKISLFFMDPQLYKKTFFTLPDLALSFSKSFTIIFGGDSLTNGFTATIQQEY